MYPIALITDFGTEDYFVGAMKGSILSVNSEAKIVDITHQIPNHDIEAAGFVLRHAAETFPEGSVFVGVVDPGVGTDRRCILVRTENDLKFVGPDNGLFTLVAEDFELKEVRNVTNEKWMRENVSETFHGRDIMAPAAAHLSLGENPEKIGPKVENMKKLETSKPEIEENRIEGKILKVDGFGNMVTNIGASEIEEFLDFGDTVEVNLNGEKFEIPFERAFGEVPKGENLCHIGSGNLLEIAKNQGRFVDELNGLNEDELNVTITLKE